MLSFFCVSQDFCMMQVGKSCFCFHEQYSCKDWFGGVPCWDWNYHSKKTSACIFQALTSLTLEVLRYGKVPPFFFEMGTGMFVMFQSNKTISEPLACTVYMWNSCASKRCCLGLDSVVSSRDAKKSPGTNLTRHEEGSGVNGAPFILGYGLIYIYILGPLWGFSSVNRTHGGNQMLGSSYIYI